RRPLPGLGVALWRDTQSGLIELHALADRVVHHLRDIAAAFGAGEEVDARHLFAKGADVEVVDRLPHPSAHARRPRFRLLSGLLHAVTKLNCSRTSGNQARAAGCTICPRASCASAIIRPTP